MRSHRKRRVTAMFNIDGIKGPLGEILRLIRDGLEGFTPSSLQKLVRKGGVLKKRVRELVLELGAEEIPVEPVVPNPTFDSRSYNAQTVRMVWRWALVVTVLTVLFWFVWYLVTGSVPVTNQAILLKMEGQEN